MEPQCVVGFTLSLSIDLLFGETKIQKVLSLLLHCYRDLVQRTSCLVANTATATAPVLGAVRAHTNLKIVLPELSLKDQWHAGTQASKRILNLPESRLSSRPQRHSKMQPCFRYGWPCL